jgi:aryl-alcohol dehydrogenase-like predicted oxidoreductase
MHMSELGTQLMPSISPENEERKLPKSGVCRLGDRTVRRIGFGTKRLGGSDQRDGAAQVKGLLRRAVELGVNHLDTAAFYPTFARAGETRDFTGLDWANDAIRRALAPYPTDLMIATKVGPTETGLARPDQLRGLVEDNLRQLGVDCLDLVYLRQTGLESVAEHFGVLASLREAGMIRHLGLSNVRIEHLSQAQEIAPVVAVQNRYGVDFGRVNDAMVAACAAQGIAFVPFFALTGAAREAGGVAQSDPVETIAREHGATPAQIRIAWTLAQGPNVLAIPGTGNPAHLIENLAAATIHLTPDELAVLNASPSVD